MLPVWLKASATIDDNTVMDLVIDVLVKRVIGNIVVSQTRSVTHLLEAGSSLPL